MSAPPETAMLLTREQWDDMAAVCRMYLRNTMWALNARADENPDNVERVLRRRAICERVVDASDD